MPGVRLLSERDGNQDIRMMWRRIPTAGIGKSGTITAQSSCLVSSGSKRRWVGLQRRMLPSKLPEKQEAHLADWAVSLHEVWLQEGVKQAASEALNRVVDGQHMDAQAILDVSTLHDRPKLSRF